MTQARGWVLETQSLALSAEIKMLDGELLSYQARQQLLEVEKDAADFNAQFVSSRTRLLEDLLSKRRLADIERIQKQAEAIKDDLQGKHPLVRELAEKNVVLGEELKTSALALERISAEDDQARANANRIGDALSDVKRKLEVAGLSQALGMVLMEQRRALPNLSKLRKQAAQGEKLIGTVGLQQIQYSEERRHLRDIGGYMTNLMQDVPQDEADAVRADLRELIVNRQELLDKAIATDASYLRALSELDLAQRQLIDVINDYDNYLNKRLLWIRSTEPISRSLFQNLPQEIAQLVSPSNWRGVGKDLLRQLADNPLESIAIAVLAVLTLMRWRFLRAVVATGEKIVRIRDDRFTYTWQAVGWTALAAAPLPLLLMATGTAMSS